ncbi:MAG: hypothetical protein H6812_11005 [Phycisphaeraceae bacterium]|nr:hypothetical protein [Phycisphaerales bacterium]MCB9843772.1 hypothetical protein [Phycisphaeraceae bacterium]
MEDTQIPSRPAQTLSPDDLRAMDALAASGFRGGVVPEGLGDRSRRLLSLLALLDTELPGADTPSASDRRVLVDVTMARVRRSREDVAARIESIEKPSPLAPMSADEVDALFAGEAATQTSRASGVLSLLGSGAGLSHAESQSLIDRTMGLIEAASRPIQMPPVSAEETGTRGWSFRLRDVLSIAAVLLIGISVMWPMLVASREQARMIRCADNSGRAGVGFTSFATDHDGRLPQTAGLGSVPWWNVGEETASNSSNLYRLADLGYVQFADLACPGNPDACTCPSHEAARDWKSLEQVSYSYQIPASIRPLLQPGDMVVLMADRSPVILRAIRGEAIDPDALSPNHGGRGQHVLMSDGSIRLLLTPHLDSGDNIWLPGSVEGDAVPTLSGFERPSDATDAFVGP